MEVVTTVVLKAAVGFLFGQATHLLQRWTQRSEEDASAAVESVEADIPTDILAGHLGQLQIHWDDAGRVVQKVEDLWQGIAPYANGLRRIDKQDETLVKRAGELRGLLEAAYGKRITFQGETREPSGTTMVRGDIEAQIVKGTAGGIVMRRLEPGGTYEGKGTFGTVEEGGTAGGVIIGGDEREG